MKSFAVMFRLPVSLPGHSVPIHVPGPDASDGTSNPNQSCHRCGDRSDWAANRPYRMVTGNTTISTSRKSKRLLVGVLETVSGRCITFVGYTPRGTGASYHGLLAAPADQPVSVISSTSTDAPRNMARRPHRPVEVINRGKRYDEPAQRGVVLPPAQCSHRDLLP